jgi:ataxia telangiectasia mutated family protein
MSSNNLRDVLAQVRSEKIKDRQDGLASLRTWFTPDKAVRNFDTNGDGKPWLVVYQALFTAVALEKKALSGKKATATAERRLSDVASFMRTLTERSAQRLNKKVVKALLAHFMQTMVHDGALLSYVALDYAKAIRSLLSWSPHQDHLEEQMWLSLVELSFNVILEDNLKRRMDEEDNQDVWAEEEEGEEDDAATEVGTPRKRRHASATPTPTLRSVRDASAKTRRLVTQEQTEFMAILSLLFQTSSTPLLSSDYPHFPNIIFARLLRFLRMYSADNSLQRDFLVALNALVGQLALNCKDIVTRFAISSWDNLVSLWNSKTKENREVLLSVLLSLLPYYVTPHVGADVDLSLVTSGISRLAAVLDENLDSRKGVEHLEMEAIQLGLSADDDSASIRSFHRRTFQVGVRFEAKHASTWATLTLHADCLAYVCIFFYNPP